ncbi:MAG: hypothetical protein LLG00_16710 [Planctomycetaceae bacterium]|nr:hypothetical protein [Planctomycetaceae bacterium]
MLDTTGKKIAGVAVLVLLALVLSGGLPNAIPSADGSIASVTVVVETATIRSTLTEKQIAWIESSTLRSDLKAAKIAFAELDPGVKDKSDKTPESVAATIKLVGDKAPQVVIKSTSGKLTAYPVPADNAAARKLFGIGGAK